MIIGVTGAVGSGKTIFALELSKKLNFECFHLNDLVKKYKLKDVPELQTFDFDLDAFLDEFEKYLKKIKEQKKNIIVESHFAHFINPELVDVLFVINRDLKNLKIEYDTRKYNEVKIKDNLEVESFNLCFYESEENGYDIQGVNLTNISTEKNGRVFTLHNSKNINYLIEKSLHILEKIKEEEEKSDL